MILITHIIVALASLTLSAYAVAAPSRGIMRAAGSLVGLTLATGTALIVVDQAPILRTCLTGLAFVAVSCGLLALSRQRLARTTGTS